MLGKTRGGMWTLQAYAVLVIVPFPPLLGRIDYLDYLDLDSQLLILSTQRQQEPPQRGCTIQIQWMMPATESPQLKQMGNALTRVIGLVYGLTTRRKIHRD
jgi:hypothetical protein